MASIRQRPALAFSSGVPEHVLFEALLADVAARFADIQAAEAIAEIERALARLIDFFGYDRGTYSEFETDSTLQVRASAAARGFAPNPQGQFGADFAWFVGALRAGKVVALPRLPEDLPPQAKAEAEYCARIGLRSHLSIPLRARGRVVGVISFARLRAEASGWSAETITRLTILGEIFAGTLARARSEEEAHRLRVRFWHADRVARVGALTAAIAHEINQPLAAILSNAQAGLANLDRGEARPEVIREILEAVVRDDKRAAETIRTMRAFLRQDEGSRERIDLAEALREALQLLATELGRQGIRIETRLEPGCWVRADKTQIEQVALNLVLNAAAAMQACPPGERVLRLRAGRVDDGRIAVEVDDTGPGIPAEHIDAVFEPFWTTRKNGLGLGLAICRSIVEAHDGAIRAVPNAGRGVTLRFELAADAGAGGSPGAERPAEPARAAAAAGPAICVIDDDAAVRESLERLLSAQGRAVVCYASADEFLERAPAAEIGCLLLDNQMPGVSGRELQERLAARGTPPPIVFLTGHGSLAIGVAAMKRGAVDFLVKPVEAGALAAAVGRAFARHAGERSRSLEREACQVRLERLSARERQVMDEVVRGRLNKQIAADLDIALQTVKQHRARVMDKMEVGSVAELVRVCETSGLLNPRGP